MRQRRRHRTRKVRQPRIDSKTRHKSLRGVKDKLEGMNKDSRKVAVIDGLEVEAGASPEAFVAEIRFNIDYPTSEIIDVNNCYRCGAKMAGGRPLGFKFLTPEARRFKEMLKEGLESRTDQVALNKMRMFMEPKARLQLYLRIPEGLFYYKNGTMRGFDCSNYIKIVEDVLSETYLDDCHTRAVEAHKESVRTDDELIRVRVIYTVKN